MTATTLAGDETAPDGDDIASVADGRARIDMLDGALLALLAERRQVSTRIQQLRVDAGGSRVEHSRENAIVRRYAEALGDGGAELGLAVLGHCRGRR
jgi:chorismate mutase